jgi:hypothetical protein
MKEIKDTSTEAFQSLLNNESSVSRVQWFIQNYQANPLYNEDLD